MSLSEQIGKGFQSTQSRFRNSPKRRRCNAIECNFSVKKNYAFAVCMFCTSDIVNGASFLQSDNIFSSLASIGFGIFFTLLCFVPFYSIKHRTRLDFSAFAKNTSQTGFFFVSSYYCMYFTVITVSFLIRFCDMFVSGVNPDVNTKVIAFLILCICVYGASKGINPLSRVSIFVLAFLIIAFAVIFFGNIKSFEFAPNSTFVTPDFSNIRSNVADCLIFAFLPVIFGFNSTSTKNLSIKQPVITTLIIFGTLMLTLFFTDFVIGAYSAQQPFLFSYCQKPHISVI